MLLEIVKYPDERLRRKCVPVEKTDDELRALARDMLETMYDAPGVGLAAPQIGRNIRMLVLDPAGRDEEPRPRIVVNPRLTLLGEKIVSPGEGCLSVPLDYRADVIRNDTVRLEALDEWGSPVDEIVTGFEAVILQHEFDHLEGLLFIDHISRLKRNLYEDKVRKWLRREQKKQP